nr:hypothetical protein [Tanacetum cinerariifolium]
MRKITFRKAVEQKFKEYDQKLETLSSINVPEAIKEVVQAKVMTEIKKQLPTYVPTAITKFVKLRLNNSDPPNDREGKTRKKRRKDAGEPSFGSLKKYKLL